MSAFVLALMSMLPVQLAAAELDATPTREQVQAAVLDMAQYLDRCRHAAQRLTELPPVPLNIAIAEAL